MLFYADFTFIHSKFLAPLPPNVDEFLCSLRMVFPHVIDVQQLMKEIRPLRNVTNIPTAISYLKDHFFAPIDVEILQQGQSLTHSSSFIDFKGGVWAIGVFYLILAISSYFIILLS